jgi:hypothetical protein
MSTVPVPSTAPKEKLQQFEKLLDAELANRGMYSFDSNQALMLACNVAESAAAHGDFHGISRALHSGIETYAPYFTSGKSGAEPDMELLVEDLIFGAHYHYLRDLLYYSYNSPGSFIWTFSDREVQIHFSDRTIPRQFFTTFNEWCLLSLKIFDAPSSNDELTNLLKQTSEFEVSKIHDAIAPLIEKQVDLKLSAYFSILDSDLEIDLGGYSYRQFIAVYRVLLTKALYHRYHSKANEVYGCVFMDYAELLDGVVEETGFRADCVGKALKDLIYDATAVTGRTDPSYFSLIREGAAPHRVIMRPFDFSMSEGLVQLLRVVAHRRPNDFLSNVSNILGTKFVQRVEAAFEAQGFTCRSEVSLSAIDPKLPDIDLLVICEEPTLGFVLFVCEVKSPLPPRWAKDQLKVLARDSVSKAFQQVEALTKFMRQPEGIEFIRSILPNEGIEHFDDFVVVVKTLVITSDNAGMFFGQEETPVVNFRTLERLLERSDGDVHHILTCIRTYNEGADQNTQTAITTIKLGDLSVSFEGITPTAIMDFPQAKWRNTPERQQMIDAFVADGQHPFDCLEGHNVIMAPPRCDPPE